MLYAVMESDLRTLSPKNIVVKYADDTNVLVPADFDIGLLQEFNHVKQCFNKDQSINQSIRRGRFSNVRGYLSVR